MIQVYTPRQLPCDGGASKLHGQPQSQLHSPRRDPDIRHSETMVEPVPRGNGPRMIKDAATSQLECNPGGHNMHRLRISGYRRAAVSRSRGYAAAPAIRPVISAFRSPKRLMNRFTRPPWTVMFNAPTTASDTPTSTGPHPYR